VQTIGHLRAHAKQEALTVSARQPEVPGENPVETLFIPAADNFF
jgi:hypothetical protein